MLNWTGTATATVNGTARAKGESFTLPANTNATVRLIGGTASQVQLEPGSVATPFEHRSFGAEVALCQRYYEEVRVQWRPSITDTRTWYNYRQIKRAAPTATYTYDVGGTGGAMALEGMACIQNVAHSGFSNGLARLSAEL